MTKINVGDLVQYKGREYVVRAVLNPNSNNPQYSLQAVLDDYVNVNKDQLS